MSSASMPPPAPLSHRRSTRLVSKPGLTLCPPKMSLTKGATFHQSSSLPSEEDPVLSIHHLARRSPTCSKALLATWLSDQTNVAQSIADFEQTFSGARGTRRRSTTTTKPATRAGRSVVSDEGLGTSVTSDRSLSRKFERALDLLDKDSAMGTSISDKSSVGQAVQGWLIRCVLMCNTSSNNHSAVADVSPSTQTSTRTTVTQTVKSATAKATDTSGAKRRSSPLSSFARKKINRHIIAPLLREERFEDFHSLVTSLGSRNNKHIKCLRDVEQSLLFQPLVSCLLTRSSSPADPTSSKTLEITPNLYRAFGEFSIQLVLDTYQQLPESEQRRASDRPYDNGYFLDLVDQVNRLAAQVGASRSRSDSAEDDTEEMAAPYDEVTLEGGLDSTGNIAELVGWKNGEAISLRTGQPYQPLAGIKRDASSLHEDGAARSMARHKKGYKPDEVSYPCEFDGCTRSFPRKCDKMKHEKTHTRPHKCPVPGCRYAERGLPTEKERDRHIMDKHEAVAKEYGLNPTTYHCKFCEFTSKRESNAKQHMEKKHAWEYKRAKGKDKQATDKKTPAESPAVSNFDFNSSLQSPALTNASPMSNYAQMTGTNSLNSNQISPYEQSIASFDNYNLNSSTNQLSYNSNSAFFPRQASYQFGSVSSTDAYTNQYISPANGPFGYTPDTSYSNLTDRSPWSATSDLSMGMAVESSTSVTHPFVWPTPESMQSNLVSRGASFSNPSPMFGNTTEQADMYGNGNMNFDPTIGGHAGLPDNDFDLFSANAVNPAFSNPSASAATLFPAVHTAPTDNHFAASQFAALDNDPLFDETTMDDLGDATLFPDMESSQMQT